jgi:general secretion pathway protein J
LDQSTALLQLERALQGAFPHSFRNLDTLGREVYFDGRSDELAWVSTVSPQRNPGLTAWRLVNVDDEGVYLQLAPALSDYPGQRLLDAEPVLLISGYQAEFSYLFEDLEFERRWRDEWDGALLQSLPMAVHIRLTRTDSRADDSGDVIDVITPILSTQHRTIQPTQGTL